MTAHALASCLWPLNRIGEALQALAVEAGFGHGQPDLPAPPPEIIETDDGLPPGLALARWMENAASHLGLEAEPVEARFGNMATLIRKAGPALLRVHGQETVFLVLLDTRRGRARLLGIDRKITLVDVESVRSLLCLALEAPLRRSLEGVFTTAGTRARDKTIDAILLQQLGGVVIRGFWMLRWPPSSPLRDLAAHLGLKRRVAVFFLVHALEYLIWLGSWWAVGRGILSGRIDTGWLWAWGLLLLTAIPLHLLATWLAGLFAIDAAALLRQRLLAGAMQLDPGEIRGRGAGALLGLVFEADAVEALALGGGLIALMSTIEIAMTAAILCLGPAALWEVGTLAAGVVLTGTLAWRYYRQRREWTEARLALTDDLVEGIVGISTRVVQQHPDDWHVREDAKLAAYLQESRRLDRMQAAVLALIPRGWLLAGVLMLANAFIDGSAGLAISVGGVLLGFRAFRTLTAGLTDLAGSLVAWERISPLQGAAALERPSAAATLASVHTGVRRKHDLLLDAIDVRFSHERVVSPILRDCNLGIRHGDRLLLEGDSGSGKSTFGAILAGLREPSGGLLLLGGLDLATLGRSGWRQRVVAAPQFHENHIFSGSLAYNALLGRRWPARRGDIEEAETVCRELGLGPLLDRMPSGMLQLVGESGWQLSHGERSRIHVARALLQGADLVILDESFAALDPQTLGLALGCVLRRARTLLVIAHP